MENIYLRKFEDADLELFKEWLEQGHIKPWFNYDSWVYELERHNTEFAWIKHYIVMYDDKPIGFCQYYDYQKGGETFHDDTDVTNTFSIDYLIGDKDYLGKHLARMIIKTLEEEITSNEIVKRMILQPEKENLKSRNTIIGCGYGYNQDNDFFFKDF